MSIYHHTIYKIFHVLSGNTNIYQSMLTLSVINKIDAEPPEPAEHSRA